MVRLLPMLSPAISGLFRRNSFLVIALMLLLASAMTYYDLKVYWPGVVQRHIADGLSGRYFFGADFYPVWLTAREALLRHRDPYSEAMTSEIQKGLFGRPLDTANPKDPPSNYRAFAYPAFVDLLFWPLSFLPFPVVRLFIAAALTTMTAASIWLWLVSFRLQLNTTQWAIAIMLTLSSYAVLEGLRAVQLGLFVGFLIAASLAALARDRFILAGSLLAFALIKPQMSIVIVTYLLVWSFSNWRKRSAFVLALVTCSLLLTGTSMLVWPNWIAEWLHTISSYGSYSQPALIVYTLAANLRPRLGLLLLFTILAVALILIWKMRHQEAASPRFALAVSLLLALTCITLVPGQAVHDHVILLPGVLLIACNWRNISASSRPLGLVLAAAFLALFWQWALVIPILVARYFLPPAKLLSNSLLLLPFDAATFLPLVLSAILGYMMAKALHRQPSV
jgi:hypothetical protein